MQSCTKRFTPEWLRGPIAGLAIVLVGCAALTLRAEQAKTAKDGVYSDAQASRGQGLYGQRCAACHAADLTGSGAPPLAGQDFISTWNGMSVDDLVEKIATSMPSDAPGSLSRIQATDLVAFILKSNNFPAGSAELDSDASTLNAINIVE
jgi:mono/diheme cytochrome c family protein